MRNLLFFFALAATGVCARAQSPASPSTNGSKSDWTQVQVLAAGTPVHLKTIDHGSVRCMVNSADAESLTCGGVKFEQAKIRYVKTSHRLRSTFVGVGVGYGAAIALSVAAGQHCKNLNCSVGYAVTVAFVDLGLVIATPIVFGVNDLTAGTIYKNPAY